MQQSYNWNCHFPFQALSIHWNVFSARVWNFSKKKIQLSFKESTRLISISPIYYKINTLSEDRISDFWRGTCWRRKDLVDHPKPIFIKPFIAIVTLRLLVMHCPLYLAINARHDIDNRHRWFMKQRNFERLGCLRQIGSTFSSSS